MGKEKRVCADCHSSNLVPYGYTPRGCQGLKCGDCACLKTIVVRITDDGDVGKWQNKG